MVPEEIIMISCNNCGLSIKGEKSDRCKLCDPCSTIADCELSMEMSPLSRGDLELVLAWRSNPEIYRHFRGQDGPLEWQEHIEWFESRPQSRYDFVIHYDGRRVGVVSLNEDDEVGILIGDFSARGEGVATAAVEWLCNRFESRKPLFAEVHDENTSSRRLFERCGFELRSRDGSWVQYVVST